MTDADTTWERGNKVRREVLGDTYVNRAQAGVTDFRAPFADLLTRVAWGEVWTRPGLSRAERSMITLATLVTLRQDDEIRLHVRGALRNGVTREQVTEVLMQVAIYAGMPASNRAFALAQDVLTEMEAAGELP